jgi:hypothetical protein
MNTQDPAGVPVSTGGGRVRMLPVRLKFAGGRSCDPDFSREKSTASAVYNHKS